MAAYIAADHRDLAKPKGGTSLPLRLQVSLLLALAAALPGQSVRGEDKPAAPAGKQVQATLALLGQVGVGRPEGLLTLVAVTVPKPEAAGAIDIFTLDPPVKGSFVAAMMVGVKDPLVAIALYRHGANNALWVGGELPVVRRVRDPELDREQLVGIEDGRRIPTLEENPDEYKSYLYVISYAHDVPIDAMRRAVKPEITYAHLLEAPGRYRGEIVRVSGQLKQLRKWPAPRSLWNDGIRDFYEALIISDVYRGYPYWVALTEVPSSIKVGDNLDYEVDGYAYFFKRTYLEQKDRGRVRAPLLVAGALKLRTAPAVVEENSLWNVPVFLVVLGLAACGCLVVVLLVWFMRGDRAVQSRLAGARTTTWVAPTETAERTGNEPRSLGEPPPN